MQREARLEAYYHLHRNKAFVRGGLLKNENTVVTSLVTKDEGEYCGDGIKEYDGTLGKYRILIKFNGAERQAYSLKDIPQAKWLR